jgi:cellulose synthase/poly-beta-1,6-N-acetylglucosamine synthase-like glycosyltransferase
VNLLDVLGDGASVLVSGAATAAMAFVLCYFLLVNGFNTLLLACATVNLRVHLVAAAAQRRNLLLSSPVLPRISVLAPAYREQDTLVASVTALLTLSYPALEVIVVNDGSPDLTMERLQEGFDLEQVPMAFRLQVDTKPVRGVWRSRQDPHLLVVDKDNGGKADALNAGLNLASGDLVCAIDADTLIEPDALLRMVRPFLSYDDCIAVGGTIRVANGSSVRDGRVHTVRTPRNWLAGIQSIEYLRAFLLGRLGWNSLGGNLIISGAFGLFRRESVLGIGGYLHDTVGEDMELVARLRDAAPHGGPTAVRFVPDPVAWTEVPESRGDLGRQRDRWQRGLTDVLRRYRSSIFNPRKGRLGLVIYPYFLIVEWLAPVVEGFGLLFLGAALPFGLVSPQFALAFFVVAYLYGIVLSLWSVLIDSLAFPEKHTRKGDLLLTLWAVLEQFGYRQLTILWRLRGMWRQLRSQTLEWGEMTRKGFGETPAATPASATPPVLRETADVAS